MSGAVIPTHRVPRGGLQAWTDSDASTPPVATLDPGLEVQLVSRWGDWANVRCTNGWTAWVDGRKLESLTATPAGPPATPSRSATASMPSTVPPATAATSSAPGSGSIAGLLGTSRTVVIGGRTVQIGAGMAGAALVALGSVLSWIRGGGVSVNSFDVPVKFLFDPTAAASGPDLGLLLLAGAIAWGTLCVLATRARERRWIGIAVVAVAVVYTVQLQRLLGDYPADQRPSLLSSLGFGVYLTAVGGGLMIMPTPGGDG